MKKIITVLVILALLIAAVYSGWGYYQKQRDQIWNEKLIIAKETLKPIKQSFKATLMHGMSEGVEHAVDYCKVEAPQITQNIPDGVEVGRVSHRVRNPKNKPSELLEGPLNYYLQLAKDGNKGEAQLTQLPDNSWLYVEPIYAQPMCLACHGDNISPSVKRAIDIKYPDDKATGFEEGDLRGMFWLKFKEDLGNKSL